MENRNLNETIALNVTMNVVLITAISFLMKKDFFIDTLYTNGIIEFYGVALILLIWFYVAIELKSTSLTEKNLISFKNYLLVNLAIAGLVLGVSMYPQVLCIDAQYCFTGIVKYLIAANIVIPFILFLRILNVIIRDTDTGIKVWYMKMSNTKKSVVNLLRNADDVTSIITVFTIFLLIVYLAYVTSLIFNSENPDVVGAATIGILVFTAVVYMAQMELNKRSHLITLKSTFIVKQLEELYMPLKHAYPTFEGLNVKDIEKYSYLAASKLDVHIEKFIEYLKSPDDFTFDETYSDKDTLYKAVASAVDGDIKESLMKDVRVYLNK